MSSELSLRRRVFFGVVVAALVLTTIEVTCQLFYRVSAGDFLFRRASLPIVAADPTRCYRLKPNLAYEHETNEFEATIYTNSQGMRTDATRRDVAPEKPAGVYRILFLGASFAFGWGNEFEDIYPTVIGEMLRATGKSVEIVNLGAPAQSIEQQLCWLEGEGRRFRPDMVVQTLSGQRVRTIAGECPERLDCPVIEDSKLYTVAPTLQRKLIAYAKNLGIVFYGYYAYQWALGVAPSGDTGTGEEHHDRRTAQPETDDESLSRAFTRYEQTVGRALGEHVDVVFLFIPMSFVVHLGDAPRWSHVLQAEPSGSRERIRAAVDALRARGHVIIDTTPALVERADQQRLYYWLDIHPNAAGNRIIAETALPVLADRIDATHAQGPPPSPTSSAIRSATRSLPAPNE